jgi:pSer/pThr/pTyr-binding forkhead associated (FHA) protein
MAEDDLDQEDTSPAARREPCPRCDTARSGDDRYCEACGYDFDAPPGADAEWELVATADRQQFERFAGNGITFPTNCGERRFTLEGSQMRIGRSRGSGGPTPEIDLAGSPEDPGISRLHAVLERKEDGGYALRDLGSTNGTTVNDDPQPVDAGVAVPLTDGDRIRIGAWTAITVRAL